ncbi:MAG: DUF6057 family protein [Prevotella sp.]
MNFNNSNRHNSTAVIKAVCAIVFCLFSFVYLFYYQADILAVAQHVLSGGVTHYDRTVGCVIIIVALLILQVGTYAITRLDRQYHALTYFPSLLILAVITDISPDIDKGFSFGAWLWLFPLLLLIWGLVSCVLRNIQIYQNITPSGFFSRNMWINLLLLTLMFFGVGTIGNGNDVFHYRMRAEYCLLNNDTDGALAIGAKSLATDSCLTQLRAYALAKKGLLGEKLFTYPVKASGEDLVPSADGAHCIMYPNDSIFRFLGALPSGKIKTYTYLKALERLGYAKPPVRDYILCGYLLDRKLDAFVHALPSYYEVNDSLPKHYREALTLYTHLRSKPYLIYHNVVMDTDFNDLQTLEKQYPSLSARKLAVLKQYAGTYWWYYQYGNK